MADKRQHKSRIKELEGLFAGIKDTGEVITIDSADPQRYAMAGQLEENTFWANLPTVDTQPLYANQDDALADIKAKNSSTGYLPKQKPLLYRIDYHEMALRRAKDVIDPEIVAKVPPAYREYFEIIGRQKECADWLRVQDEHGDWGTLVVGKEGREAKMPTFGSKTEVEMHIQNRHLGMGFTGEKEVQDARKNVYKDLAKHHANAVDRDNAE